MILDEVKDYLVFRDFVLPFVIMGVCLVGFGICYVIFNICEWWENKKRKRQ